MGQYNFGVTSYFFFLSVLLGDHVLFHKINGAKLQLIIILRTSTTTCNAIIWKIIIDMTFFSAAFNNLNIQGMVMILLRL